MDKLLEVLGIKEYISDYNKAFLLKENSNLSGEDIKNIEKYMGQNGITCNAVKFNGKIKFIYITEKYRTLTSILTQMEKKNFVECMLQIVQCLCKTETSGKLDIRKVLIDKKYIFWDDETKQVKLIYLPVKDVAVSKSDILGNLITFLKEMIQSVTILDSRTETDLISIITNPSLNLEEMYENIFEIFNNTTKIVTGVIKKKSEHEKDRQLVLQMIYSEKQLIFRVQKKDFVIGRSVKFADGVIPDNKMVGRKHCKIRFLENKYYLEDLDSKNGTFLNGKKLLKNESKEIATHDVIRLANVEFVAKYLE